MTITQTIGIPTNCHITLEIPSQIMVNAIVLFKLVWSPRKEQNNNFDIALDNIWNLYKIFSITIDSFLDTSLQNNKRNKRLKEYIR